MFGPFCCIKPFVCFMLFKILLPFSLYWKRELGFVITTSQSLLKDGWSEARARLMMLPRVTASPAIDVPSAGTLMGAVFSEDLDEAEDKVATGASAGASAAPRRVVGAQRPEDAAVEAERAQRIHSVFDPSLGVYRSVRESGEVVEQCVSRAEQQRMMQAKARVVQGVTAPPSQGSTTYTGRDKFPSQHPWFGFK